MQEGSMTAAPPPRDSALDALGFAIGVLRKPGFLWAPIAFTVIFMLPLLWLPGFGAPYPPGFETTQSIFGPQPQPAFATQAEFEAYFASLVPSFVAFTIFAIVLGPVASAVFYRLALQYVEGESPRPFAPGIVNLAWRFFLQTLALLLLAILGSIAVALISALTAAILGAGFGILTFVILALVLVAVVALRLGLAPVFLLWGAGPIEAIDKSWALTRGHVGRVFRWFVVIGVLIGALSAAVSSVIAALFSAVGLALVGQLVGTVLVAPLGVVQSIGFVQLARLLSNPIPPPAPPEGLPDWMTPGGPAGEPPTAPPTAPST
jgi:hypothetical protein